MVTAIIVAGGRGVRMADTMRKQYLLLAGRPILSHTLLVFDACRVIDKIFLVVPEKDFDYCRTTILFPLKLQKSVSCVPGGPERQDSVYNGLLAVDNTGNKGSTVVIHDGVRPFIRPEELEKCVNSAKLSGACILGIPSSETLKIVNNLGRIDKTLERDSIWHAQTPQAFHYYLLRKAHERARQEGFTGTDDAMLVERLGETVTMIKCSRFNIKITTREDLSLAEAIVKTGNWKRDPQITQIFSD